MGVTNFYTPGGNVPLTTLVIKQAKPKEKRYKLFDGGGLYLLVTPTGGKFWQLKYRLNGEKTYSIGSYPSISLPRAREKREELKMQIRSLEDPNERKKEIQREKIREAASTFEAVAREWLDWRRPDVTERYWNTLEFRLETYLFPELGSRSIATLKAYDLLPPLRKVEREGKLDLLRKLVQNCSAIFRYAVISGFTDRDAAADLRGAFRSPKRKNNARLNEADLPEFFERLRSYHGEAQTKIAMEILVRTFVRTIELRGARWEEINFETAEWIIPAERMKMGRDHLVPLSDQVIALFEAQRRLTSSNEYVFPIRSRKNPFISENRLLYALYDMGYKGKATIHGFRGTASTILNEKEFNRDWIEMQLAHWNQSSVRNAYNHAQYRDQRRNMMQWYSDHLDRINQ